MSQVMWASIGQLSEPHRSVWDQVTRGVLWSMATVALIALVLAVVGAGGLVLAHLGHHASTAGGGG